MKRINALALALFALTASAQNAAEPQITFEEGGIAVLRLPQRISSEYINMSYCSDDIQCSLALENGVPTKTAIAITRGMLGTYSNAQIVGVRVGLANNASNVSGWIVEGNDPSKSIAESSPTYSYKDRGWTDLIFRSPYEFSKSQGSNAAIILGYTSTGENQIGFDGESEVYDNGNFMWTSSRGWGSVAKVCRANGYGNACVQVLLGGIEMPTADMAISDVTTRHAEQGQPFTLTGTVSNKVPTPVTSYVMTYSINGSAPTEVRQVQNVNNGEQSEFTIEMPGFEGIGPQQVTLSITSVNGETDAEPADNTFVANIESIEAGCYFPQVHVVEESTNIMCGFCPRGIVVMESLEARHPGRFIGLAVHSDVTSQNDPLFVPAYYNKLAFDIADPETMTISEPKGIINRRADMSGDPLFWDIWYDRIAQDLSVARLTLVSTSEPTDGGIDVHLQTRFAQSYDNHKYRVAFVLVEDNVKGLMQSNYYAGGNYGSMNGWEEKGNYVSIPLNNVARGIWNYDGLEGSLPAVIEKKHDYVFDYRIDLSGASYNIVENLSVVALLIDGATGHIVQADRLAVGTEVEGVHTVLAPVSAPVGVYNLNGQRISTAQQLKSVSPALHGVSIENGRKVIR